jgi:hypothetical protein
VLRRYLLGWVEPESLGRTSRRVMEIGPNAPGRVDVQLHAADRSRRSQNLTKGADRQRRTTDVDFGAVGR